MLNLIWIGLFLSAFCYASIRFLLNGDAGVFAEMMQAVFSSSKNAFEISLGLSGTLAFWLGMLAIGEQSGVILWLTKGLSPLFRKLLPGVPDDHPALGAIVMNLSANVLGLDNAATPLGIKAMQELQSLNPSKDTASDAQILFFVINASSITLFPLTLFTYRAQMGAAFPADVFIPILLATFCSTLAGLLSVAAFQRIKLHDKTVLIYLIGLMALVGLLAFNLFSLPQAQMQAASAHISHFALLALIALFLGAALVKKVDAYQAFIQGAKSGFDTAIHIVPYLVAMLVAVGVFRASGLLDAISLAIKGIVSFFSLDDRFVDALPVALIKPFSGSGARALMLDSMRTYGVDSFVARLATIIQGSTETTFYVLAVYFGAVGIKNVRHAIGCGLLADLAGVIAATLITYRFFA